MYRMKKYTEEEYKKYWMARCEDCGWKGLTVDCSGFGQIADTGDYDDGYCPKCNNAVSDVDWERPKYLKWIWRRITFWVARKNRRERIAEENYIKEINDFYSRDSRSQ